jgi:hypothetical protein
LQGKAGLPVIQFSAVRTDGRLAALAGSARYPAPHGFDGFAAILPPARRAVNEKSPSGACRSGLGMNKATGPEGGDYSFLSSAEA